jgi:deoxyribose-phosphate aldolase
MKVMGNPADSNTIAGPEVRPALADVPSIARLLVRPLLAPDAADDALHAGLQAAIRAGFGAVCVRPSDVDAAVRLCSGRGVTVASVVGFPHGGSTTAAKIYETRDLLRRGAREIEMVINLGKLRSRQFQYVEAEILQVAQACHESQAIMKVVLENSVLTEDLKVIACKIAKRAEADIVKTATGFARPSPGWEADITLLKRVLKDVCQVEAGECVDTVDAAVRAYELGADRLCTPQAETLLATWAERFAPPPVS